MAHRVISRRGAARYRAHCARRPRGLASAASSPIRRFSSPKPAAPPGSPPSRPRSPRRAERPTHQAPPGMAPACRRAASRRPGSGRYRGALLSVPPGRLWRARSASCPRSPAPRMGAEDGALTAALGVPYRQTQGGDDGKLAEMHGKTRRRGRSCKLGKRGERLLERA
jgi:hypothetical protein